MRIVEIPGNSYICNIDNFNYGHFQGNDFFIHFNKISFKGKFKNYIDKEIFENHFYSFIKDEKKDYLFLKDLADEVFKEREKRQPENRDISAAFELSTMEIHFDD